MPDETPAPTPPRYTLPNGEEVKDPQSWIKGAVAKTAKDEARIAELEARVNAAQTAIKTKAVSDALQAHGLSGMAKLLLPSLAGLAKVSDDWSVDISAVASELEAAASTLPKAAAPVPGPVAPPSQPRQPVPGAEPLPAATAPAAAASAPPAPPKTVHEAIQGIADTFLAQNLSR